MVGSVRVFKTTIDQDFASFKSHRLQSGKTDHVAFSRLAVFAVSRGSWLKLYRFNKYSQSQAHKFACDLNKLLSLTEDSLCVRRSVVELLYQSSLLKIFNETTVELGRASGSVQSESLSKGSFEITGTECKTLTVYLDCHSL